VAYPEPLERLITAFERFPGIGRRSAERLSFHVLRDRRARELAPAIEGALRDTKRCSTCSNVAESDPCALCIDPERDAGLVLVVEQPRDVEAIERSGAYKGRYHVLMGALNPVDGTDLSQLTVGALVHRARTGDLREIVIGTDPDAEGEATALALLEALDAAEVELRVTRLARGLPAGSALEYLHRGVIEDAFEGRVALRR
jgi:recombination protein RecR